MQVKFKIVNTSVDIPLVISLTSPEDANVPTSGFVNLKPSSQTEIISNGGTQNLFIWRGELEDVKRNLTSTKSDESLNPLIWSGIIPTSINKPLIIDFTNNHQVQVRYDGMNLPEGFTPMSNLQKNTSTPNVWKYIIILIIILMLFTLIWLFVIKKKY